MTETAPTTGTAPTGTAPSPSRARRVAAAARPVWRTAFAEPVRDSHLRLGGLGLVEKQAARLGLVTLVGLLVSVLFGATWRHGQLLPVEVEDRIDFVPTGLVPVTLVAFLIAWLLLTWGALSASPAFRLVVAATYLLVNASIAVPTSIQLPEHHRALDWGPTLLDLGYYVVPGVLVVSVLLNRVSAIQRVAVPVYRLLLALGCVVFFVTPLWIHVTFVGLGFEAGLQRLMSGAVTDIGALLLPLVFVSGILVIDFALDVAEGVSESVRDAAPRLARWLLVALLAVKLWWELGRSFGDWVTYVSDRHLAVTQTLAGLALLAVVAALVTRGAPTSRYEDAKERLMYGSGAALAVPSLATLVVVTVGVFAIGQLHVADPGFVQSWPSQRVLLYGRPVLSVLALAGGILLLRRKRGPMDFEMGSGLVMVGAWTLPIFLLLLWTDLPLTFSDQLADILVTIAVAAYVAVRWRRLDASAVVTLAALTVFVWLALSKGDWIAFTGSLLGLPAILVVVVGIAFSLAGDAAFTAESSPRLPQGARVLMFVGYLVLSVTILHWLQISHSDTGSSGTDNGFFLLGIPWAAWLVGRRLTRLDEGVDDDFDGIADAEQVPAAQAPEMH